MLKSFLTIPFICSFLTINAQMQRANAITSTLKEVVFPSSRKFYQAGAPIQTGKARRSEPITIPGLYNIMEGLPEGYSIQETGATETNTLTIVNNIDAEDIQPFSIYNGGNKLPLFKLGTNWYTYVRTLKDFYNDRNYIWAGNLYITGTPLEIGNSTYSDGWIENDGIDALVDENGKMTKIYRYHKDTHFSQKNMLSYGPTWRHKRIHKDLSTSGIARHTINFKIPLNIDLSRPARLTYAVYDEKTSSTTTRNMKIEINSSNDPILCTYSGRGEKYFSANFNSDVLISEAGLISITITNELNFENYFDFVELYVPVLEDALFENSIGESVAGSYYIDGTDEKDGKLGYYNSDSQFIENGVYDSTGNLITDATPVKLGYSLNGESTAKVPNSNYYDSASQQYLMPGRLIVKIDENFSGPLRIKYGTVAIDVSQNAGTETNLSIDKITNSNDTKTGIISTVSGKTVYVTSGPVRGSSRPLLFDTKKELRLVQEASNSNYVAIAPSDHNYFLKLRSKLTNSTENNLDSFVLAPWQEKTFASNLYETWLNTSVDGKSITDIHIEQGLSPITVKLEDIIDTYACGIYSPQGVINFLEASPSINYVCLVSATSCGMKKQAVKYDDVGEPLNTTEPFHVQVQGVPTDFFHDKQVGTTTTDDVYCNGRNQARAVGRVLAFTDDDLIAWLKRRIAYTSPDTISLWAGKEPNNPLFFTRKQAKYEGILPSIKLDYPEIADATTMRGSIISSIEGGTTLGIYQGHGALGFIDNERFLDSKTGEIPPPASYIWATCNTGEYYLTGYSNSTSKYANIAYHYMKGELATEYGNNLDLVGDESVGAVNIIAASGVAAAYWEDQLVDQFINKVYVDKNATWGEMFRHGKINTSYNVNSRVYHLFGDPALKVIAENPRNGELEKGDFFKDTINVSLEGDWATNAPVLSTMNARAVRTDGTVAMELAPINISDFPYSEMIDSGTDIVLDISDVPVESNLQIELYTNHSSGTFVKNFTTIWGKSELFTVDREPPYPSDLEYPQKGAKIVDNVIYCKSTETTDSKSGVAYYQFTLVRVDGNISIESPLCQVPEYSFHPSEYQDLLYGDYQLFVKVYDKVGNVVITGPRSVKWRRSDFFDEGIDVNANSIADAWEEHYFGTVDFTDGNQDSNGNGYTDKECYEMGLHPYEFKIQLEAGWNLISLPNTVSDSVLTEVMNQINSAWLYNAATQNYDNVDTSNIVDIKTKILPLRGFWAFCIKRGEEVTFTGTAPSPNITVSPSWNLIGPAVKLQYNSTRSMSSVHGWDMDTYDYVKIDSGQFLNPAKGYWIYNNETTDQEITVK